LQREIHENARQEGLAGLLAPPQPEGPAIRSIVKLDMLVENDRPLLVPHDVVTMQTIAILVKIIFAFGAGEFFQ
jgi:hypothetical protein